LYGVKAIAQRHQVKRNIERFSADFMFQLTQKETENVVSQKCNVIKEEHGWIFALYLRRNKR
jgi:hypothetical protein